MSDSSTDAAPRKSQERHSRERALIARFKAAPLGPYDPELLAFLQPLRNLPGRGKHALMRMPARGGYTLVRLGDRLNPVEIIGGFFDSLADAEWAVFRARWMSLHGWDPEISDE
jgi:hypothetical protein